MAEAAQEAEGAEEVDGAGEESEKERIDREMIELLNELRVALPGVQVLFAFLLAVPFAQRWGQVTAFERDVYFATLLLTALSSALLIAPSAYHRIEFRAGDKRHIVMTSNVLAILGLGCLALAIVGAVTLIASVLFGTVATIVTATTIGLVVAALWFVIPLARRAQRQRDEARAG